MKNENEPLEPQSNENRFTLEVDQQFDAAQKVDAMEKECS